jgi:hypothetical protein
MKIWAITSYFNPAGYATKLHNFKMFRAALGLPLVVVELVFSGGESELAPHLSQYGTDKVIHIIIRQGDVLWQKERLLNVALSRLPQDVSHVVWIDCDLIFHDSTWIEHLTKKLRVCPIVQCFETVRYLPQLKNELGGEKSSIVELSKAALSLWEGEGLWTLDNPSFVSKHFRLGVLPGGGHGMVWAGQVDLLRKHGLYDARIVGGGDLAFAHAVIGVPLAAGDKEASRHFAQVQIDHYESWASAFRKELLQLGPVGCLDDIVYHLWHGERMNRRYATRYQVLVDHAFDPNLDIRINAEGTWSWNSDKPEMHKAMKVYFQERQEDSRGAGVSSPWL